MNEFWQDLTDKAKGLCLIILAAFNVVLGLWAGFGIYEFACAPNCWFEMPLFFTGGIWCIMAGGIPFVSGVNKLDV